MPSSQRAGLGLGWGRGRGGCGWRCPTPQQNLFFTHWASGHMDGAEHIHGHASVSILAHFIKTVVFHTFRGFVNRQNRLDPALPQAGALTLPAPSRQSSRQPVWLLVPAGPSPDSLCTLKPFGVQKLLNSLQRTCSELRKSESWQGFSVRVRK